MSKKNAAIAATVVVVICALASVVAALIGIWSTGDMAGRWGGTAFLMGMVAFVALSFAVVMWEDVNRR